MSADPAACDYCERHPGVCHLDWHPTKAQLWTIGRDLSRRAQMREKDEIRRMDDETLIAYGQRLRRMLLMAEHDDLPDFLVDLVQDWLKDAEREVRWRQLAARKGGDAVVRSSSWSARVETVKSETDLGMLIAYECAGAEPAGPGKWKCCCPFHEEDTASLHIDTARGLWHCFGCQEGGDAIRYVQRRHDLGFKDAVLELERRLGITHTPAPFRVEPVKVWSDGGSGA